MELLLVFLSTAIGTLAGVGAAMFLMQRKDRRSSHGGDSALRTQLQNTEWALSSAGHDVVDLRQKLAERDEAAQTATAGLEAAERRLAACIAESEAQAQRCVEAEMSAAKAAAQAEALAAHVLEMETAGAAMEEALRRAEALEAELDSLRQNGSEAGAEMTALEAQLDTERERAEKLAAEITAAEAQLDAERERAEKLAAEVATTEALLSVQRERAEGLAAEMAAILSVRAALENALRTEREAAAEGVELLQMAHGKFCVAAQKAAPSASNGRVNGFAMVR
jgi:chromosome segregation ATPase